MTTRRRLFLGAITAFAAAFAAPAGTFAGLAKRAPLRVTYYFLPG